MKIIAKSLFITVIIFSGLTLARDWYLYPIFNYHDGWEKPTLSQNLMIKLGVLEERTGLIQAAKPASPLDFQVAKLEINQARLLANLPPLK